MKRILTVTALLFAFAIAANAQTKGGYNRDWGVGLKLGYPSGITVKKYFNDNAFDITVGSLFSGGTGPYVYSRGISVSGTYQWRREIAGINEFEWYYGIGGLVSARRYSRYDDRYYSDYRTGASVGALGVIGLEYFIPNAPISVNAELSPYLEVVPAVFYPAIFANIGARFTF